MTFILPPEFGERVTLVIESFFAMCVVILNVSDSIPVTSDATPIIVKLLLAAMFEIGAALYANSMALNMYKSIEVPQWVRVFFLHYLARMMCISTGHPKADVRSTRRVDIKVEELESDCIKLVGSKPFKPVNLTPSKLPVNNKPPMSTVNKIAEGINELAKSSLREEDNQLDREFWVCVSQIADRIFLILFSVALIAGVCSILSEIPGHYTLF